MSNYIVCPGCEKKIEFERPLFCPFCGIKLEPVDGLDLPESNESDIYPWSNAAPILMKIFMYWVVIVIPFTLIFGRKAFLYLFSFLLVLLAIYSLVYLLRSNVSKEK